MLQYETFLGDFRALQLLHLRRDFHHFLKPFVPVSLLGLSDFSSGGDSSYGAPSSGYGAPSSGYGAPGSSYGAPSSGYGAPSSGYGAPSSGYGAPSSGYNSPSSGSSINSNFNSVNTNSLTVANPVPNLGGAKVADLYYLYPELFQNQVGAQNDQNIGNIDYTDDPQGEDYVTRLLDINNYLGLQNYQQQQHQNGQPLQLHQRLGQPQHQIYDPYIITPEQLQMQLMQIEQAGK